MNTPNHLLTGLAVAALTAQGWSAPGASLTQRASAIAARGATAQPAAFQIGATASDKSDKSDKSDLSDLSDPSAIAQLIGFKLGSGAAPQTRSQNSSPQPSTDASATDAFVRVTIPKPSLYVGELVPVQVKAYFRAGTAASLNGLPLLGSDAFSLGKIGDHPDQTQEMLNGQPFTVLTWDTTLSGVKAGDYPLNIDLPATIRVRQKARRGASNPFKDFFGDDSPFGNSPFGDSFFDDFFNSSFSEKEVTLHTDGAVVKVEPQPAKGRPTGFSGAVGDFDVSAEAPASTATVGEPFTLKIKVSGKGNFDRVNLTGLARTAIWKTYRPSAKFAAADPAGFSGEKTFEQVVTPNKAGAQQLPSLSFSYFDPSDGHYVTKHTQPIMLDIAAAAPGSASDKSDLSNNSDTSAAGAPSALAKAAPSASPVRQSPIASLQPLILRPWFIAANAILLLAVILGALVRRMASRRSHDPGRLARETAERSIHASLASLEEAEKKGDGPGFFLAARHALQERLAAQWRVAPNAVTGSLITRRLNGEGDTLRAIFRAADEASYSKRAYSSAELRQWHDTFTKQLNRIPTL